jgi:hypothetical protein
VRGTAAPFVAAALLGMVQPQARSCPPRPSGAVSRWRASLRRCPAPVRLPSDHDRPCCQPALVPRHHLARLYERPRSSPAPSSVYSLPRRARIRRIVRVGLAGGGVSRLRPRIAQRVQRARNREKKVGGEHS